VVDKEIRHILCTADLFLIQDSLPVQVLVDRATNFSGADAGQANEKIKQKKKWCFFDLL